eukprot:CAMPEP_0174946932 /NCGR_PEP_ID=MMETSP1355-20121228/85410_1 /TAXON_ID=464990 /ORGANISM="Hemiselmis tepida, Strain CCMP443" /LENGTH=30 /DNA_ID= /DNA_START= /DNA_END= /DNA_ORIENTATION=
MALPFDQCAVSLPTLIQALSSEGTSTPIWH